MALTVSGVFVPTEPTIKLCIEPLIHGIRVSAL